MDIHPPTISAETYSRLMHHLTTRGGIEGLFLADEIQTQIGPNAQLRYRHELAKLPTEPVLTVGSASIDPFDSFNSFDPDFDL